jgi:uncharacterized membrane protein
MESTTSSPWPNRIGWALQILLGIIFIGVGCAKLLGVQFMVDIFDKVALGQWLRYITGIIEIIGGLMLLRRQLAFYGALLLSCVMIGAFFAQVMRIHDRPQGAIFLLALLMAIAWLRRPTANGHVAQ